jgi:hypothetical protein
VNPRQTAAQRRTLAEMQEGQPDLLDAAETWTAEFWVRTYRGAWIAVRTVLAYEAGRPARERLAALIIECDRSPYLQMSCFWCNPHESDIESPGQHKASPF